MSRLATHDFEKSETCMFKKGDKKKACKEEAKRKEEKKKKLAALKKRKKKCLKVDKSKELQTKLQREYWAITTTKKRKEAIIMELVKIAKCLDKCKLSDCAADDEVKRIVVKALNKNKGKYDPKVTLTRRRAKTAEEEEEELKMSYESSDDDYYPMSGCEEEYEEYEEPLFEFSGPKKRRGALIVNGGTEYLNELDIDEDVKGEIMGKSFLAGYDSWKKDMKKRVDAEIDSVKGKGWVKCKSGCHVKKLKKLVHEETLSTAYVLRAMANSIIGAAGTEPPKLEIRCSAPKKITGVWKDDKTRFELVGKKKKGKLIMGFGPSASGKTFWAKNLISILFPKEGAFLSIDGGLYREVSDVYQTIKKAAIAKTKGGGLTNLVAAGLSIGGGMFKAGDTKKTVFKWLKKQPARVNLYVPETLGSSATGWHKFRKYTGSEDNWIGACIYMHKHGKATGKDRGCPFTGPYRCFGCTESGTRREKSEGKKYSNTAYAITLKRGMAQAKTAEKKGGGYLLIHNVGPIKGNISTIQLGGKLAEGMNMVNITKQGKKYNFRIVEDVVDTGYRKRSKSAFCPEAPPLKF